VLIVGGMPAIVIVLCCYNCSLWVHPHPAIFQVNLLNHNRICPGTGIALIINDPLAIDSKGDPPLDNIVYILWESGNAKSKMG